MSKRFIDTNMMKSDWFMDLPDKFKLSWLYLLTDCDHAGIWSGNTRLLSFTIGHKVTKEDLVSVFEIDLLEDGKMFIQKFVSFQYGTLREECKPHKSVIDTLKKYGIFQRVSKGYTKSIHTLKDKDKEKDKEKDKDKEKEAGEILNSWNAAEIITHKETGRIIAQIVKARAKKKDYSQEEIETSIKNYRWTLDNSEFFKYKWSLVDFLSRENTIKFFPDHFTKDTWTKGGGNGVNWDNVFTEGEQNAHK